MKVKEIKEDFKPIELVVTIESPEELVGLWLRTNLGSLRLENTYMGMQSEGYSFSISHIASSNELWTKVNELCERFHIDPKTY